MNVQLVTRGIESVDTEASGPLALQSKGSTATESRSRNRGCRGMAARGGYKGGFSEGEGDLKNLLSAKRSHL